MAARTVNMDVVFGRRLRLAMAGRNVTNIQLAKALKMRGVGQVGRWRRGEQPDPHRIPLIEDCLELPHGWLALGQVEDAASGPLTVPERVPRSLGEPRSDPIPSRDPFWAKVAYMLDLMRPHTKEGKVDMPLDIQEEILRVLQGMEKRRPKAGS